MFLGVLLEICAGLLILPKPREERHPAAPLALACLVWISLTFLAYHAALYASGMPSDCKCFGSFSLLPMSASHEKLVTRVVLACVITYLLVPSASFLFIAFTRGKQSRHFSFNS